MIRFAFVFCLLSSSALAAEHDLEQSILNQVKACWSHPAFAKKASAKVRLSFDSSGALLNGELISYSPKSVYGKSIADSVIRAIERCQPYVEAEQLRGPVVLEFNLPE